MKVLWIIAGIIFSLAIGFYITALVIGFYKNKHKE